MCMDITEARTGLGEQAGENNQGLIQNAFSPRLDDDESRMNIAVK